MASRQGLLQLSLSLRSSLRSCRVLARSKMQKESAARPQKRVLQEADSQAGRMRAHRCPTPSLWRLSARARGLAPAYLVKSRILECRAAADAPTAPPRSPPHNAGTASQTCPLSPPTARALGHLALRTGLPSAMRRDEEEEEENEEFT